MPTITIHQDDGSALDASFDVEELNGQLSVVLESRGGTRGTPGARNTDYAAGLEILLSRLAARHAQIADAAIDSVAVRNLPITERRLDLGARYPVAIDDAHSLRRAIGAAQARLEHRTA